MNKCVVSKSIRNKIGKMVHISTEKFGSEIKPGISLAAWQTGELVFSQSGKQIMVSSILPKNKRKITILNILLSIVIFVQFLEELRTPWFAFEILWPLTCTCTFPWQCSAPTYILGSHCRICPLKNKKCVKTRKKQDKCCKKIIFIKIFYSVD